MDIPECVYYYLYSVVHIGRDLNIRKVSSLILTFQSHKAFSFSSVILICVLFVSTQNGLSNDKVHSRRKPCKFNNDSSLRIGCSTCPQLLLRHCLLTPLLSWEFVCSHYVPPSPSFFYKMVGSRASLFLLTLSTQF